MNWKIEIITALKELDHVVPFKKPHLALSFKTMYLNQTKFQK